MNLFDGVVFSIIIGLYYPLILNGAEFPSENAL